jgi:hypothetical protein
VHHEATLLFLLMLSLIDYSNLVIIELLLLFYLECGCYK